MSKAVKILIWVASTVVYTGSIICGFWFGVEWCRNIAMFLVWLNFITSAMVALHTPSKDKKHKEGRTVHRYISYTQDIATVLFLAAIGEFVLASISAAQSSFEYSIYDDE